MITFFIIEQTQVRANRLSAPSERVSNNNSLDKLKQCDVSC